MAAEVSSLLHILTRYKKESDCESIVGGSSGGDGGLVTKDLLGGCSTMTEHKAINLDPKVKTGSDKQLDLMFTEFFYSDTRGSHDLSLAPPNLELKLFPQTPSCSSSSSSHHDYTSNSVCTLDKVKSALRRANMNKNQHHSSDHQTSPTSSSVDDEPISSGEEMETSTVALVAAGCPSCLSYVLVTKENPTCPRCSSEVPTRSTKRARIGIDLNTVSTSPENSTSIPTSLFNDHVNEKKEEEEV